jgi:hypothetical protein
MQHFGNWICFHHQMLSGRKGSYSAGPITSHETFQGGPNIMGFFKHDISKLEIPFSFIKDNKVKLSSSIIKHYAIEMSWINVKLNVFLTSVLGEGRWSASRIDHFALERTSDTPWMVGCVGSRCGLDTVPKRKISVLVKNLTLIIQS